LSMVSSTNHITIDRAHTVLLFFMMPACCKPPPLSHPRLQNLLQQLTYNGTYCQSELQHPWKLPWPPFCV
jgi:hypothetical protein